MEQAHASQYGIAIVSARIAEMVLRDERAAIPIGSYQRAFGVTLSLPSIVGRTGVMSVLQPELSAEERKGLDKRAASLKAALERVRAWRGARGLRNNGDFSAVRLVQLGGLEPPAS